MKFTLFCAALLLTGCGEDNDGSNTDLSIDTAAVVDAGLRLDGSDAYDPLFNASCSHPLAVAAGLVRIAPGDVDNSYLHMRIIEADPNGLGSLMPPFLSGLSIEESARIEQWTREGAQS